ncbi:MAG TPA: hypothetical protein VIM65_23200 [Cyclobacteriaceae bacterium]
MMSSTLFRNYFLSAICILHSSILFSQISEPQVVPPSPESKALEKFIDQPIDYFRGTPEITIPIWTIEQDGLKIPITLSYHSGGIQVSEIASNEGLGWSLIGAGGSISRELRGEPDDSSVGFINFMKIQSCPLPANYDPIMVLYDLVNGRRDYQTDNYSYTLPTGSGKFVFDNLGNTHQTPQTPSKIIFDGVRFTIIDENGITYKFNKFEQSYRESQANVVYTSTWHLETISFPGMSSDHDISFAYETYETVSSYPGVETVCIGDPTMSTAPSNSVTYHGALRVKTITYKLGTVVFNYGEFRQDSEGAQRLKEVVVKDFSGNTIKSFELTHAYMRAIGGFQPVSSSETVSVPANSGLRLSLMSLTEKSSDGKPKPPYEFFYETSVWLPDRFSKAVDFWGYYNGKTNNTTLVPDYEVENGIYTDGGDRYPSSIHVKAGNLVKLKYPTGGYTEYDYEIHKIDPTFAPQIPFPREPIISHLTMVRACQIILSTNDLVIDDASGGTVVKLSLVGMAGSGAASCSGNSASSNLHFVIFNSNNLTTPFYIVGSGYLTIDGTTKNNSDYLYLPNGQYKVKVYTEAGVEATDSDATINVYAGTSFNFTISGYQQKPVAYKNVGGLRIKEIRSFSSNSSVPLTKSFDYTEFGEEIGTVNIAPVFTYTRHALDPQLNETVVTIHTSNSSSLGYYTGVGYAKVTEFERNGTLVGQNGKVEYSYQNPEDLLFWSDLSINSRISASQLCYTLGLESHCFPMSRSYGFTFPFTPPVSHNWRRGLLKQKSVFKTVGAEYKKQYEIINTYKDDYYGDPAVYNPVTDVLCENAVGSGDMDNPRRVDAPFYYIASRLIKLVESQEITYDENLNPDIKTTDYYYDDLNHLQPTRIVESKSDTRLKTTFLSYPEDYTNTTGFIAGMKSKNIRSKSIEKIICQSSAAQNDYSVLSGSITTYYDDIHVGETKDVRIIQTSTPIALSNFKFSNQSAIGVARSSDTKSSFDLSALDTRYSNTPEIAFTYNDFHGNISTIQSRNVLKPTSYIWGYNASLPIAKVLNAASNEIAYTSFESNDLYCGWTYSSATTQGIAATGDRFFTISAGSTVQTTNQIPSGNYTVDFFAKGNVTVTGVGSITNTYEGLPDLNGWKHYTKKITMTTAGSITLTGATDIDELRLSPEGSQMTTFTYKPLIGMSSQNDSNGVFSTYQYDSFGRLRLVRDKDGKLIQHYQYNYQR